MTEIEFVELLRRWATDNRAQADAKEEAIDVSDAAEQEAVMRWFAGLKPAGAQREQIEAQAASFRQASYGNKAAAKTLRATATAWDEIADIFEQKAPSS